MLVASGDALDPALQKYASVNVHTHNLCSSKDFDDLKFQLETLNFCEWKFSDLPFGPLIL